MQSVRPIVEGMARVVLGRLLVLRSGKPPKFGTFENELVKLLGWYMCVQELVTNAIIAEVEPGI